MSFIARLREDIENVRQHDPAARGAVEIALNYSGMHAIWVHRLTHKLWQKDETKALYSLAVCSFFLTGGRFTPARPLAAVSSSITAWALSLVKPLRSVTT